jgi:hypothetical protein
MTVSIYGRKIELFISQNKSRKNVIEKLNQRTYLEA